MPFFEPAAKKTSPFDQKCAKVLYTALQDKRLIKERPNLDKWADSFRILRTANQITPQRIKRALLWFTANIKAQYTPKLYSAESFKKKFIQIEDVMKRASEEQLPEITPAAIKIQKRCGFFWPTPEETKEEIYFIQVSLNNALDFKLKMRAAARNQPGSKFGVDYRVWQLTNHLSQAIGVCLFPDEFVFEWLKDIHHMAYSWDGWQGKLKRWRWHAMHPKFLREVEPICKNYTGHADDYRRVLAFAGIKEDV